MRLKISQRAKICTFQIIINMRFEHKY